jgi:hypothetical protein
MCFAPAVSQAGSGCPCCDCINCPIDARGPCNIPCCLEGTWEVSHCLEVRCDQLGHSWIRFQNVETGEVHTAGLYLKGFGGVRDSRTGCWIVPPAETSGLQWDTDLVREPGLRRGEYYRLRTVVQNPRIYRGRNCGFGHGVIRNNCVTYSRDAWCYYSGEYYDIPCLVQTTNHLIDEIEERHPQIAR